MEMPQIDFSKPLTLVNTLEPFALILNCMMVALRDEANFHDNGDQKTLDAATLFSSMLEDAHSESVELIHKLERRILGMS